MKKLLLTIGLLAVAIYWTPRQAFALDRVYVISDSTAIVLSTPTTTMSGDGELLSVSFSSGSPTFGASYLLFFATTPLINSTIAVSAVGGDLVNNLNWDDNKFPTKQLVIPPIILYTSSVTFAAGAFTSNVGHLIRGDFWTKIDLRDPEEHGVPFKNGLVMFKLGSDVGTVVLIEYRVGGQSFRSRGDVPTDGGIKQVMIPLSDLQEWLERRNTGMVLAPTQN